jgi:hypothetical protein
MPCVKVAAMKTERVTPSSDAAGGIVNLQELNESQYEAVTTT